MESYLTIILSYNLDINMNKIHVLNRIFLHFTVEKCKNLEYIIVIRNECLFIRIGLL